MTLSALALPVAAHIALVALTLCLTLKQSLWRLATIPVVFLLTLQACGALDFFGDNQLVNPMTAGYIIVFAIHHVQLLFLAPIGDSDIRRDIAARTQQPANDITVGQRLKAILYLMSTPRGVDTPYESKGVQYPSGRTASSRLRFLVWNMAVITFQYLMIDLVTHEPPPPEDIERMFGPGQEFLLFRPRDIPAPTTADVGIHLGVALMAWGPMGACFISIFYRIVAVISVAFGVSGPRQWPSLFGSVTDAYTIRRFWGRYWHQLLRQPFQGTTKFICRDIFHLPYPSSLARYLNIILVFFCSALMHACIDAKGGIGFNLTGAWACFLLQPVGIIVEDIAEALYARLFGELRRPTPFWVRMVGYMWVWAFLALVAPLYNFPLMRHQVPARNGVPFSVIRLLRLHFEAETI
ncbi:wax synthase family protein [Aspergillus puulaauensis]|uniref:Wax synthase domain-containing protein n=1 Tax=Aspergillus puulaauensis TaxID=1220207 RepID=A0A7R7XVM9_9EURO|nr:uncharacterized protein APUU_61464S [Aspergillus puulaauensis]BCS28416.1 hypothetical protein APUU_61464S [Aspergillus puulaauensis]